MPRLDRMRRPVPVPPIAWLLALWVGAAGCGREPPRERERVVRTGSPLQVASKKASAPQHTAPVDTGGDAKIAEIPAGQLVAGSTPGDPLRDSAVEMDDAPTKMTPFEIERRLREERGATWPAAKAACEADGMRLCTELEWEWACKGPENRTFASGDAWDPDRQSPFGVAQMGTTVEWTASRWGEKPEERDRGFTLRGGRTRADDPERRCAHRSYSPPNDPPPNVAFRCCRGDANEAVYEMERWRRPFRKLVIPEDRIMEIVRSIPELAPVHDQPHLMSDADVQTVLSRAGYHKNEPAAEGWHVTWSPIMWSPRLGEQLLVLAGRGLEHSFVAALQRHPGDRYTHAASMILLNDTQPLAIGYGGDRRTIAWANCWGCTEGGFIFYEDDRRIRITHR